MTADHPATVSRRRLLQGGAAAGAAGLLAPGLLGAAGAQTAGAPAPPVPLQLFAADDLNFQVLFAMGGVAYGAGEVGEIFTTVDAVNFFGAGYQTVVAGFSLMGQRIHALGEQLAAAGHLVSARSAFLRAAQYYNQSLFFVLGSDAPGSEPDVFRLMDASWRQAVGLVDRPMEPVEIPYEGSTLPCWLMKPDDSPERRPTVIVNNGSDGQNIDIWSFGGVAAVERGYNALLLTGPGQGSMLFEREIPFRPDWEAVITPVVDYLVNRPDVDPGRIALTGWSFGGELTPRAAAFEPRLAALVADPGCVDAWLAWPEELRAVADAGPPDVVNRIWQEVVLPEVAGNPTQSFDLLKRGEIYSREVLLLARQGVVTPDWAGLSSLIRQYQNRDVVGQIRCPVLVLDYEADQFYPGQPQELVSLLNAPADYVLFTAAEGAAQHCAPMAPQLRNQVVFDWLDDVLGR